MFPPKKMKHEASIIVGGMGPLGGPDEHEDDKAVAFEALAHDIIKAVKMGNAKDLADHLKDFFEMSDSQEDEHEMPSLGEES